MIYRLLILCFVFSIPIVGLSQDTRYSNFYSSRSYVNPALASAYKGDFQAGMNYRQQWSSLGSDFPFQSYSLFANKKFDGHTDAFSIEARINKDDAPGRSFQQNTLLVGMNYKKMLSDGYNSAHFISVGVSGGVGQNKANWGGLWFGNQFDFEFGAPNMSLYSGEGISELANNVNYGDINLGLSYEGFYNTMSINAGISISHINRPNISFAENIDLYNEQKYSAHVSFNFWSRKELKIVFTPMYSLQGVFHELTTNFGLAYEAEDVYDISFGLSTSPKVVQNFEGLGLESISFLIFIEKKNYRFNFAYDATVSRLSDFNSGRGGFEFGLIYTKLSKNRKAATQRFFHFL